MNGDQLREDIKRFTGDGFRYLHTLGVERECASLAEIFSLPEEEKRELCEAALLHDITKQKTQNEQKALYEKFGEPYGAEEENSPKILHAVTGAYVARETYPSIVTDRIFRAIRLHTAGAPDMTLFDKLLYLADYIEPGRTYEDCVQLRRAFYDGVEALRAQAGGLSRGALTRLLDQTVLTSFQYTLQDLLKHQSYVYLPTVAARNAFLLFVRGEM